MELLTGECKKQFEAHLLNINLPVSYDFNYFTLSMQYGVYKQFFSNKGILIHIKDFKTSDNEIIHECNINGSACGFKYDNLDESIMQIVKIANKHFNDKNN